MWRLAGATGTLDRNSPYCYLMLCRRFAQTCVVVEGDDGQLAGFVAGYRPPDAPEALFVWQVAVAEPARGRGLALEMLRWLLDRNRDEGVTHLEATVTPSNAASQRLFRALARSYGAECEITPWLAAEDFPDTGHEAEELFRIGPLYEQNESTNLKPLTSSANRKGNS